MDGRIWTYGVRGRDPLPHGDRGTSQVSIYQEIDPGTLGIGLWNHNVVWVPLLILQVENSRVTKIQVQILWPDSPAEERVTW